MSTQATILNVFVASPSDIIEERIIIESVIDEVNKQPGKMLGIRLEVIKFESDIYPRNSAENRHF